MLLSCSCSTLQHLLGMERALLALPEKVIANCDYWVSNKVFAWGKRALWDLPKKVIVNYDKLGANKALIVRFTGTGLAYSTLTQYFHLFCTLVISFRKWEWDKEIKTFSQVDNLNLLNQIQIIFKFQKETIVKSIEASTIFQNMDYSALVYSSPMGIGPECF